MSLRDADRIDALYGDGMDGRLDIKLALTRLCSDTRTRREHGSVESVGFFVSAYRTLSRIRGVAHSSLRMSCLWECGVYFETHGYFGQALDVATQLQRLATRASDNEWLRKSHMMAGILHAEMGNLATAMVSHEKALVLARQEDIAAQISALVNIGVALNYGALYREAIPCFTKAAELASSEESLRNYFYSTLGNMAQCHFYLEEYRQGYEVIRRALGDDNPSEPRAARSRAIREWTYVVLALQLGKLAEAREHSLACRHYAQRGNNPRALYLADLTQGLCEVYGGDVSKGLALLEAALQRAEVASARQDVLRALVQAYDEAGLPEPALQHLNTLMTQMKNQSTQGLNAASDFLEGPILIERNDESAGLRPLKYRKAKLQAKIAQNEAVSARIELLERLAITADLKEDVSGAHGYRVGKLSSLFVSRALGWSSDACSALEHAARLHDIGKIGVPDRILLTSEALKEAERDMMSAHTLIGSELLGKSHMPQLCLAEEIARCHHEWWNGRGYPAKLKEKRIPIHARIVAIADFFDASTHGRPYAKPWPIDRAVMEIQARSGSQFDPDLVEPFIMLIRDLVHEHGDLDEFLGRDAQRSEFAQARQRIRQLVEERNKDAGNVPFQARSVH